MRLNEEQFEQLINKLNEYLQSEKVFVKNPIKTRATIRAVKILHELFPDDAMEIKDDPLQMGAVVVCVDTPMFVIRGKGKLNLFSELASIVDNFEIINGKGDEVHFAAVIQNVYIKI